MSQFSAEREPDLSPWQADAGGRAGWPDLVSASRPVLLEGGKIVEVRLLNAAVVVVATEHNPTILHPAFLKAEGIVPLDWELAEDPISTPAFSVASYTNGIAFTVESAKLQILDTNADGDLANSPAPDLAIKYIQKLPYVRYTAIGVNFTGLWPCLQPVEELVERFLKQGSWNDSNNRPQGLTLNLVYPSSPGQCRFSLDPGVVTHQPTGERQAGIVAKANYHSEIDGVTAAEQIIALFQQRIEHFTELTKVFLATEG
jgi:hypothetical protein